MVRNMNKKGWLRIVEVFVAIIIISLVLLIVLRNNILVPEDNSSDIHKAELAVLRDIQVDDSLRDYILNAGTEIPSSVQARIDARIPNYLDCVAKICGITAECDLESPEEGVSIYAQSVAIAAISREFDSKQLKLFCWVKQ